MLSNQVLLKTITDMKGITGAQVSLWNLEGTCLLGTDEIEEKQRQLVEQHLLQDGEEDAYAQQVADCYISSVCDEDGPCYLLMLEGVQGECEVIGGLCVSQLESLLLAYKERLSKVGFLQNLLQGDYSGTEIGQKAERVHFSDNRRRVVFVIEPAKEEDEIVTQTLKSIYVTGITDFVITIDKQQVVFIKELSSTEGEQEVRQVAQTIVDMLNTEAMVSVYVGNGTIVNDIASIPRSYHEGKIAIEVGRSFKANKRTFSYSELGIGRLIHQLTQELCEEFLQEVLGKEGLAQFDDDTMQAAYKFFENDLNISSTARALYVHRNTLSLRLEKIQAKTGLDIRVFEDAITFKLAIMVSNHMEYSKAKR